MTPASDAPVFENLDWPAKRWIRSNILIDSSGHPAGVDGTSRTLTRGRDRALLRLLRQSADVIVTGGATVRAEGWHFPPNGVLLVVSSSDLPLATCPDPDRLRVVTPGSSTASVAAALRVALTQLNATRILCESGPRLLRTLTDENAIDEVFVSVVTSDGHLSAPSIRHHDAGFTQAVARHHLRLQSSRYDLIESVNDPGLTFLRFIRRES